MSDQRGNDGDWLSISDAAQLIGLGQRALRSRVDSGVIAAVWKGRNRYISRAVLDAHIEASRIEPGDLKHLRAGAVPLYRTDLDLGDR